MPAAIKDLRAHFISKMDEHSDRNKCWNWTGHKFCNGYGCFYVKRRPKTAHRIAWEWLVGSIPDGLCVLHKCDNRACCNPDHLFIGTKKDNTQDCIRKGRFKTLPGEGNHQARFTNSAVMEMRSLFSSGKSKAEIARMYSTTSSRIRQIVNRKEWVHI